ncbi:MAG TPA: hypothetical protein DCY55_12315 [Gammaproteobacteria bacterium]|jgi:prophage regulatory protein|nr:AlpA family transcriptional regulator [Pseudomonadales bacterium]HAY47047.1 hypothetical protein [Gammaproteobacteria bacterium]
MSYKILRLSNVLSATGLSRSSIYKKMDDGSFPQRIRLSDRAVGWREEEISDWIANLERCSASHISSEGGEYV